MINRIIILFMFAFLPSLAIAHDDHDALFHSIKLETDLGRSRDGTIATWDFDGWVGGDYNKLWIKAEGEVVDNVTEQSELWAMYSRNVATFWDAQIGVRYDTEPEQTTYLVAGFNGLAPYLFETEVHFFVSDDGDISARIRQENDLLISQKLIMQPYFELNLSAQDVPDQGEGAGLTDGEFGIQTRYEFSRKFAPYIDVRYERKFGETSGIAQAAGENRDDFIGKVGLRFMF